MRFKQWEFIFCVQWSKKYYVSWMWEENWYSCYILFNLKTRQEENLLCEFVDSTMHHFHTSFFKKIYFYFIINFKKDEKDN